MALMTKNPLNDERKTSASSPSNGAGAPMGTYLLDRLHDLGVEHIFGIPGDYIIRFNKLIELHKIKFINTTRENTAGYMADAYARLRGIGVACITYGVGINIANAMSQAYVESSPVVLISGSAGAEEFARCQRLHHLINKSAESGGRDSTQLEIFKHITVDQAVLDNPYTAGAQIQRVLNSCLKHQKPVYIEIPRDLVEVPISPPAESLSNPPKSDRATLEEALQEMAQILKACRRPVIWAGHEIQRYRLAPYLLEFAEKYRIPIVSSLLGKTVISEQHPLFAGVYQGAMSRGEVSEFVDSCDCAINLGVILSDVETGIFTAKLEQELKIFAASDSINIGHHYYEKVALADFLKGLADLNLNLRFRGDYPANIDRRIGPFQAEASKKLTTARVFECLESHLKPEHIIVTDFGDSLFGCMDISLEQNSFLACPYFASLGFGAPGAVAAQIAMPKRRVIGIAGDGAFQMTSMELSTAVRYHLDPVIIVLNNHGYGTERPLLEGSYNDIQEWNYSEIPRVLGGGLGLRAQTEDELDQALGKALSARGAFHLIEVDVGKTDFSPALRRFADLVGKK